ncbi:MAG: glycosidase, partial [Thermoleophilia bacterium]|nr:glycosidase [Thermoleophilia bacterium]
GGAFGRDAARTPMQWSPEADGGFGSGAVEPWLPLGDVAARNVADQRRDPASVLNVVRDAIALRRERVELRRGAYAEVFVDERCWAWRRGDATLVACNLDAAAEAVVPNVRGRVLLSTERTLEGRAVAGGLRLPPGAGVVVALDPATPVPSADAAG